METGVKDLEAGRKEVEKKIREVLVKIKKKRKKRGGRKGGVVGRGMQDKEERDIERIKKMEKEGSRWEVVGNEAGGYRELCERKKKGDNERWEKKAAETRKESDVWEIVNRERRRIRRIKMGEIFHKIIRWCKEQGCERGGKGTRRRMGRRV